MNEIILFEHANFHGNHKHIFNNEPNLDAADDKGFNDAASSAVVISGNWTLCQDKNYVGAYDTQLSPGTYPSLQAVGIPNDQVSSLKSN